MSLNICIFEFSFVNVSYGKIMPNCSISYPSVCGLFILAGALHYLRYGSIAPQSADLYRLMYFVWHFL